MAARAFLRLRYGCGSGGINLLTAVIVHVDEAAGFETWQQVLLNICHKAFAIDAPIEDTGRYHLITAQGSNECQGFLMVIRGRAAPAPAGADPEAPNYATAP